MMRLGASLFFVVVFAAAGVTQSKEHPASTVKPAFAELSQAADRARDAGHNDEAIQLYQRALKVQPKWKDGLWSLSSLLYAGNRYSEARDWLRKLVGMYPELGLGWAMLGMSEFELHDYARALDHLERAMAGGMGDQKEIAEGVFYHVAILRIRFESFDDSMGLLIAMLRAGEDSSPLVEPLGLAALRLPFLPDEIPGDRHEMIRTAGEATIALETKRREEAGNLLEKNVKKYASEPGVHFLYGVFLLDENPQSGIQELKKELDVSPSSVPARLRLAEEYTKEQNADLALPLAQEAVKLDPKRPATHMLLGEVLLGKQDTVGGIRELEMARDSAPQTVRIHWDLFRAYTSAGRNEDAKREKEDVERLSSSQAP